MKIIILHNDSCSFKLKNGKEVILHGNHYINSLSDDDFNDLLQEYPHLKTWEENGFITFNSRNDDNLKADNVLQNERLEKERNKKAEKQAVETIKKARNGK